MHFRVSHRLYSSIAITADERDKIAVSQRGLGKYQTQTLLGITRKMLWLVASVCMEPQQCLQLLALVAYILKPVKLLGPCKRTQTLWTNNTQQCWELLALVASVCMGLKNWPVSNYTYRVTQKPIYKSSLRAGSFLFGQERENTEIKMRGRVGGEKMSLHGSHCIQRSSIVKNNAAIWLVESVIL